MYKTAACTCRNHELHLGFLGIIKQFVLTMHGIGHIWEIYGIHLILSNTDLNCKKNLPELI